MTVAELIAILSTYDQDLQVVAIDGVEDIGFVTTESIEVKTGDLWVFPDGEFQEYDKPYLFLAGY